MKNKTIQLRVDPDFFEDVQAHCQSKGVTVSGLIVDLLRQDMLKATSDSTGAAGGQFTDALLKELEIRLQTFCRESRLPPLEVVEAVGHHLLTEPFESLKADLVNKADCPPLKETCSDEVSP